MADDNVMVAVRDALNDFHGFLTNNPIAPLIQRLSAQFPQVNELIDKLVELMTQLEAKIDELNLDEALGHVPTFVAQVRSLLEGASQMPTLQLPDGLDDVLGAVEDIAEVLQKIRELIPQITEALQGMKAPA